MNSFTAQLDIIGINPFVPVPDPVLQDIFQQAGRDRSPIPIRGTVNGVAFQQSLVRYQGEWRLYVNMQMLPRSPQRVGESLHIKVEFDPSDRSVPLHPRLVGALEADPAANQIFEQLAPSLQKEIARYISRLKSEQSVERNVKRAIAFLRGEERFIGREPLDLDQR